MLPQSAYAHASVYRRMEIRKPHGESREYEHRRKSDDEEERNRDVESAFQNAPPGAEPDAHHFDEGDSSHETHFGLFGFTQKEAVSIAITHAVGAGDFENLFEVGF